MKWRINLQWITAALCCQLCVELVWFAMAVLTDQNYSLESIFIKWDSFHYLEIAKNGYSLFKCAEDPGIPEGFGEWCGNAGWMPLYPALIHLLSYLVQPELAGLLISKLSFFLCLLVITHAEQIPWSERLMKGLLFSFFPGMLYAQTVFPISLTLLLILLVFKAMAAKKYVAASIGAILLPWSYATGFLVIPTLILGAFCSRVQQEKRGFWVVSSAGLFSWGLLFFFWYLSTGHWDAFFLVQEKYGYGIRLPIVTWAEKWNEWRQYKHPAALQTLTLPFILYILLKKDLQLIKVNLYSALMVIFTFIFWLFPLSVGGALSLYRSESLLSVLLHSDNQRSTRQKMLLILLFLTLYLGLLKDYLSGSLV
jgi:hypothetical protein